METLLKATWKQDNNLFLEHARNQAVIPSCPGSVDATPMRIWYASITQHNGEVEPVTCCEACFREFVRPTKLYAAFDRFATVPPEANTCLMCLPQVREMYTEACKMVRYRHSIRVFWNWLKRYVDLVMERVSI